MRISPPSTVLALDSGNTRVKAGWFAGGSLAFATDFPHGAWREGLRLLLAEAGPPDAVVWLDVGRAPWQEGASLGEFFPQHTPLLGVSARTALPFANRYATPETLGADRLAAVAGARARFPGHPLLVIDAGTALTYDYLDAADAYRGGGISPGLRMRFEALHTFTARLPLVEQKHEIPPLLGDSTLSSIQSGVTNGFLAEMEAIIAAYQALAGPALRVAACGGDLPLLEKGLKSLNFAGPHLVLGGLYEILMFNLLC